MYGQFKYDSIQSTDQTQYTNQQYSTKIIDNYSIKNTQSYSTNKNNNLLQYTTNIKEEPNTSNHIQLNVNETSSHNLNQPQSNSQQLINSPINDQWSINNYYDHQNTYSPLLTPDSQHSLQLPPLPAPESTVQQSNIICNQVQSTNLPPIQSNVQLNIQLNVQSNIHHSIDTNSSSNVQTSIQQQTVIQQSAAQHQFSNQFINQSNKFTNYDDNYSKDHLPLTKKIKTEKNNFNYNNQHLSHNNQLSNLQSPEYFQPPSNQLIRHNFQCDSSFTNQSSNFNLSSSSSSSDYYSQQQQPQLNSLDQTYNRQLAKSDHLEYSNLNQSNTQQKKLIDSSNLINTLQPIQSTSSSSLDFTVNNLESPTFQLNNLPSSSSSLSNQLQKNFNNIDQHNLNQAPNYNNQSIRPLVQNRLNFNNTIKCQKSLANSNVKRLIRQELKASIQTRIQQNQLPLNKNLDTTSLFSNPSIKLVDKKEVPKLNNNSKLNQTKLSKSTNLLLDEEEKKRRRRERNKVAATKCRNKKKAHVFRLSEQGTSLELNNKLLRNEIANLKSEEQRLVQFLLNHKTVCSLRFTMIANQLEQLCENNNQFNVQTDKYQQIDNQLIKNSNRNRIKIEPDYENLDNQLSNNLNNDDNQLANNFNEFTNQQIYTDNQLQIKTENYNYQLNNNFNNNNQTNYESNTYQNYDQTNYDQYQNSTNYPTSSNSIVNDNYKLTNNDSSSSNLSNNNNYLCTNDDNNDVFLMC